MAPQTLQSDLYRHHPLLPDYPNHDIHELLYQYMIDDLDASTRTVNVGAELEAKLASADELKKVYPSYAVTDGPTLGLSFLCPLRQPLSLADNVADAFDPYSDPYIHGMLVGDHRVES